MSKYISLGTDPGGIVVKVDQLTLEAMVIPLFTDMQHLAYGRHQPAAQVGLDEVVLAAGTYGFQCLTKNPSTSCKISPSRWACCNCTCNRYSLPSVPLVQLLGYDDGLSPYFLNGVELAVWAGEVKVVADSPKLRAVRSSSVPGLRISSWHENKWFTRQFNSSD